MEFGNVVDPILRLRSSVCMLREESAVEKSTDGAAWSNGIESHFLSFTFYSPGKPFVLSLSMGSHGELPYFLQHSPFYCILLCWNYRSDDVFHSFSLLFCILFLSSSLSILFLLLFIHCNYRTPSPASTSGYLNKPTQIIFLYLFLLYCL